MPVLAKQHVGFVRSIQQKCLLTLQGLDPLKRPCRDESSTRIDLPPRNAHFAAKALEHRRHLALGQHPQPDLMPGLAVRDVIRGPELTSSTTTFAHLPR